jgi:hypothetical protein
MMVNNTNSKTVGYEHMKQIYEVKEKPFTSSLIIYPEACFTEGDGGGRSNAPLTTTLFPAGLWIIHLKTT